MKKILFLLLLTIFLAGCAEEVIKKELAPTEMTVTIYCRGTVDTTLYKYYMIFSTVSGIKLPNINLPNPFIVRPGEDYDPADIQNFTGNPGDDIDYYYANYFHTWIDVTQGKNNNYTIVIPQGFYPTSATPTEHATYVDTTPWNVQDSTAGDVLQVKFSINSLKSGVATAANNGQIYFNFVVADVVAPSAKGGLMYDYLESEPSIKNQSGAQVSEYDSSDDTLKPAGADIIRWTVMIK
ncbi:lipoprotein [Candidatus Margulisiibacteriota bacterium]